MAQALRDLPIIGSRSRAASRSSPRRHRRRPDIHWLDGFLLVIITRDRAVRHGPAGLGGGPLQPQVQPGRPRTFTHNSPLEVAWTVVPIADPGRHRRRSRLPVLFDQQRIPEGDVVVKVTGYQWYWDYEYPEERASPSPAT